MAHLPGPVDPSAYPTYSTAGALIYQWDLPILLPQVLEMGTLYPETLSLGGNLSQPNMFFPLDLGVFTHGTYSLDDLHHPDGMNLICFVYQLVQILFLSLLRNVNDLLATVLTEVAQLTNGVLGTFVCPQTMGSVDVTVLDKYPGWVKSKTKMLN
jgi:hypothetical protein